MALVQYKFPCAVQVSLCNTSFLVQYKFPCAVQVPSTLTERTNNFRIILESKQTTRPNHDSWGNIKTNHMVNYLTV